MTAQTPVLLDGAVLIDGTGQPAIADSMVLVESNRIVYAGPRTSRFDGVPVTRWQLAGKTITPGLIEAHTHAAFDADMRAYVKNGVTTIRFAHASSSPLLAGRQTKMRRRLGESPGPLAA